MLVTSGRSGALPRLAPVLSQFGNPPTLPLEDGDKGVVRNHSAASITISPWGRLDRRFARTRGVRADGVVLVFPVERPFVASGCVKEVEWIRTRRP